MTTVPAPLARCEACPRNPNRPADASRGGLPTGRLRGLLAPVLPRGVGEAGGKGLGTSSAGAMAVFAGGAALSYLAQMITARFVGVAEYGAYTYVFAWVTFLSYLAPLGFQVSLLRFLPRYQDRGEWGLARGLLGVATLSAGGMGLLLWLGGTALLWMVLPDGRAGQVGLALFLGFAAIPFIALHLVGAAVVRAFGGVVTALAPERLLRDPLMSCLLAAGILSGVFAPTATTAMGAMLISSAATLVVVRICVHLYRPKVLDLHEQVRALRHWFSPSLPLLVVALADSLMSRAGVLAFGLLGRTEDAGIFAVASSVALLTALPRIAVASAFAPTVSKLHARGDTGQLQTLLSQAALLSLIGTALVAAPLFLVAPWLIGWFGPGFSAARVPMLILVAGQVVAASSGPQQHLITMTGRERAAAVLFASAAGGGFVLAVLAGHAWGLNGAAAAIAASMVAWNVAMGSYIRRSLGLNPGLATFLKAVARRREIAS
jgi:O-antigen/teichoic acid export membrane protein